MVINCVHYIDYECKLLHKEENFDQNNELFAVNPEKRTSLYESTALTVQCQSIKPNCTI